MEGAEEEEWVEDEEEEPFPDLDLGWLLDIEEEEWDEEDINSRHFLAVDDADRPIGTARLTPDGQIGRMAVVKELRGNGIGKTLLNLAINGAKNAGFTTVFLHAQEHAVDFYKQEQFVEEGKLFMEAGISHRLMTKQLL